MDVDWKARAEAAESNLERLERELREADSRADGAEESCVFWIARAKATEKERDEARDLYVETENSRHKALLEMDRAHAVIAELREAAILNARAVENLSQGRAATWMSEEAIAEISKVPETEMPT